MQMHLVGARYPGYKPQEFVLGKQTPFPECKEWAGGQVITEVKIGNQIFSVSPSITIATGVTPIILPERSNS